MAGILWRAARRGLRGRSRRGEPLLGPTARLGHRDACRDRTATIGAKPGGGAYHLLPFVPVWLWIALRRPTPAWRHRWVAGGAGALVVAADDARRARQLTLYRTIVNRPLAAAVSDARRFADAHPSQRIAVGYSGTSRWSDARTEIVFRTRDYLIDAPAVQEHRLSGSTSQPRLIRRSPAAGPSTG